jgi:hypothetical protein
MNMEAVSSSRFMINFYRLHGITSQKIILIIKPTFLLEKENCVVDVIFK